MGKLINRLNHETTLCRGSKVCAPFSKDKQNLLPGIGLSWQYEEASFSHVEFQKFALSIFVAELSAMFDDCRMS